MPDEGERRLPSAAAFRPILGRTLVRDGCFPIEADALVSGDGRGLVGKGEWWQDRHEDSEAEKGFHETADNA